MGRHLDRTHTSESGPEHQPGGTVTCQQAGAPACGYRALPSPHPWPRYRTLLRPKYKVGYKMVTELSWRCCPGLNGEGCPEHLTDHGAAPPQLEPEPQIPSGQLGPGPRPPPSSRAVPSPYGESAHGDPTNVVGFCREVGMPLTQASRAWAGLRRVHPMLGKRVSPQAPTQS